MPAADVPTPIVVLAVLGWIVKVPPADPVRAAPIVSASALIVKLAELMTLKTLAAVVCTVLPVMVVVPVL